MRNSIDSNVRFRVDFNELIDVDIDKPSSVTYEELKEETSFISSNDFIDMILDDGEDDWFEVFDFLPEQRTFEGFEAEPVKYRKFVCDREDDRQYVIQVPVDRNFDELCFIDGLIKFSIIEEEWECFSDFLDFFKLYKDFFGDDQ